MGMYANYGPSPIGWNSSLSLSDILVYYGTVQTLTARGTVVSVEVRLNKPSSKTVSVTIKPIAGDAVSGNDFSIAESTVTFSPGETSKTVSISIAGYSEYPELVALSLSDPQNASIAGRNLHTIQIEAGGTQNGSAPTIVFSQPSADTVLKSTAPITLDALVADVDGIISNIKFYINDSETAFHEEWVAPYDFEYVFDTEGEYAIRAVAYDNDGNTSTDSITLTITDFPAQTITLSEGWNLVSLYVQPDLCKNAQPCISMVFSNATIVKTFDAFYDASQPAFLNSLQNIEAGKGYLVYNSISETVNVTGIPVETHGHVSLQDGWNLIGVPFTESTTVEDAFGTELQNIKVIKDFESFWQNGSTLNSLDTLEQGKAYFVKK